MRQEYAGLSLTADPVRYGHELITQIPLYVHTYVNI